MTFKNSKTKYQAREELKRQIEQDRGWYFVTFVREFPAHRPYGFTLFNKPFVLLKNESDCWICYLLPASNEDDNLQLVLFKVKEKEGELWFWYG